MKAFLVFLLTLLSFSPALTAARTEEGTFSVKAEVDKAFLTVGERVEYRVTVTHDPSIQIVSKIVPPPSDAFEIKEAHDFREKEGRQIVEGRRFVITLYELGEFILEPVAVRYRTPTGEEKSVETNRLYLTVRSVDASGKPKTDIRGVKGVIGLARHWAWLWFLLLAAFIGGGGVFLWQRWRRGRVETVGSEETFLSPEDEALVRLSRLFDSDLLRRGLLKEYFLQLSEILRHFFERRFEILAAELTTSEILRNLREKEVSGDLIGKIQQVMEAADLVKFAKWKPTPPEIIRINQASKALVEAARPRVTSTEAAQTVGPQPYAV